MRALKTMIISSLAALTVGLGLVAAAVPASAHGWHHFHGGWGHHWGPGWGYGYGVNLGFVGVDVDSCIVYRATYNRWGQYVGQRPVNVCY